MSRAPADVVDAAPATAARARLTRRQLFRRLAAYAAAPAILGTYATQIEPFWAEFHEITLPVANLPRSFSGFRIAHLTDMHAGRTPFEFLQRVVARVKSLAPDLLCVTGDLVHHNVDWVDAVSRLLGQCGIPVVVSFGNHDYGVDRGDEEPSDPQLPVKLHAALIRNGCTVLLNASTSITRDNSRLWIVGLDDLWFGDFSPPRAFADVPRDQSEPVIAMSHNPDTAGAVDRHRPDLILAGHTHGGQVRLPGIGALYLNTENRQLDQGMFRMNHGSPLYVSRGIGYIRRIRFDCRPEVPVFKLVCA